MQRRHLQLRRATADGARGARTPPFAITLGQIAGDADGRGGVWYRVDDPSGSWKSLRTRILGAPFRELPVEPHVTIVHPRTSSRGPEALAALRDLRIEGALNLDELVYTATDAAGRRVVERFPLAASGTERMVGAILRRGPRVLLCLRSRDRAR